VPASVLREARRSQLSSPQPAPSRTSACSTTTWGWSAPSPSISHSRSSRASRGPGTPRTALLDEREKSVTPVDRSAPDISGTSRPIVRRCSIVIDSSGCASATCVSPLTFASMPATTSLASSSWPWMNNQRGLSGTARRTQRIPTTKTAPRPKASRQPTPWSITFGLSSGSESSAPPAARPRGTHQWRCRPGPEWRITAGVVPLPSSQGTPLGSDDPNRVTVARK
jgi:hypothetical protein